MNISCQKSGSKEMTSLMVYGNDFSFGIKEPDGWIGDIENAPKYHSNIIFYKSKEELENGGALVQVRVFTKQDENTIDDLEYDLNGYRKDYLELEEENLSIKHENYQCYSKIVWTSSP